MLVSWISFLLFLVFEVLSGMVSNWWETFMINKLSWYFVSCSSSWQFHSCPTLLVWMFHEPWDRGHRRYTVTDPPCPSSMWRWCWWSSWCRWPACPCWVRCRSLPLEPAELLQMETVGDWCQNWGVNHWSWRSQLTLDWKLESSQIWMKMMMTLKKILMENMLHHYQLFLFWWIDPKEYPLAKCHQWHCWLLLIWQVFQGEDPTGPRHWQWTWWWLFWYWLEMPGLRLDMFILLTSGHHRSRHVDRKLMADTRKFSTCRYHNKTSWCGILMDFWSG